MITNDDGEHLCTCDECGTEQYAGTTGFRDFVKDLRRLGWFISRDEDDGTWLHWCPSCVEEMEK